MTDYTTKTYGRQNEVTALFTLFRAGKDISMHGPRRLGKTFVLDRLVEQAYTHGHLCLKVEIAGSTEAKHVFRRLCEEISKHRGVPKQTLTWMKQRVVQLANPRTEPGSNWYQPLLNTDWETYLERLLKAMQDDKKHQWVVLIDELPIFLKALHDKGPAGVQQARDFMNLFTRLRTAYPRTRWLVTGSIGIDPLARAGQYIGTLSKYTPYSLEPLTEAQAIDYVQDLARDGLLSPRHVITDEEAKAVVQAVGWRAAYYLDAFARVLPPNPVSDSQAVRAHIEAAHNELLKQHHAATFGPWEEHIRKHHAPAQQSLSFAVLNAVARQADGLSLDAILSALGQTNLGKDELRQLLMRLTAEGFLHQAPPEDDHTPYQFRIPLLRLWWQRWPPATT